MRAYVYEILLNIYRNCPVYKVTVTLQYYSCKIRFTSDQRAFFIRNKTQCSYEVWNMDYSCVEHGLQVSSVKIAI